MKMACVWITDIGVMATKTVSMAAMNEMAVKVVSSVGNCRTR